MIAKPMNWPTRRANVIMRQNLVPPIPNTRTGTRAITAITVTILDHVAGEAGEVIVEAITTEGEAGEATEDTEVTEVMDMAEDTTMDEAGGQQ